MRGLVFAGLLVACGHLAHSSDDLLKGDKCGYVVWPPEVVAGGNVSNFAWSPSGASLLLQRIELKITPEWVLAGVLGVPIQIRPPMDTVLAVWRPTDRKLVEIWRAKVFGVDVEQLCWIGRSESALAVVRFPVETPQGMAMSANVLWIDTKRGTSRVVYRAPDDPEARVELKLAAHEELDHAVLLVTPDRPVSTPDDAQRLIMIPASGTAIRSFDVRGVNLMAFSYSPSGGALIGSNLGLTGGKRVQKDYTLDFAEGSVRETKTAGKMVAIWMSGWPQQGYGALPGAALPYVRVATGSVKEGKVVKTTHAAWLSVEGVPGSGPLLLSSDCSKGALSPVANAVAYVVQDALFVRTLQKIGEAEYDAAASRQAQNAAMAQAKQCAMALIMYAVDADEVLPDSRGFALDQLLPYTKSEAMLNGFTYTFEGGAMKDIKSPAETEIGHVSTSWGKAVAYADGHVKWQSKG